MTEDIENVIKIIWILGEENQVIVPYMAQKHLTILAYWVNCCYRLQESIDAAKFTPLALEAFGKLVASEPKTGMLAPLKHLLSSKQAPNGSHLKKVL